MPIQFTCPSCQKPLEAPDAMAGKKGNCPQCKKEIAVPQAPASSA